VYDLLTWQKGEDGLLFAETPKNRATKQEFERLRDRIAEEMWD